VADGVVETDVGDGVVALFESVPEPDRESPPGTLVAVDGGREGDGLGREEPFEDAHWEGGGLVDEDTVGVVRQVGGRHRRRKADASRLRLDHAGVGVGVGPGECLQVGQQLDRPREHLGGVAVPGCGHEHVPSLKGERRGGESRRTRLAPAPVGLDDERLVGSAQALEGRDGIDLVGRAAGLVGGRGKVVGRRRRRLRPGETRRRVHDALPLDASGVDVDDGHAAVDAERPHEAAPEVPDDLVAVERRDRERRIEAVAAVRPDVEGRRQEYEEAAAVDGADRSTQGVGLTLLVAVEDHRLPGGPQQAVGVFGGDALTGERVGVADIPCLRRSDVGRLECAVGTLARSVGVAGENEHASLVGPSGVLAQAAGEVHAGPWASRVKDTPVRTAPGSASGGTGLAGADGNGFVPVRQVCADSAPFRTRVHSATDGPAGTDVHPAREPSSRWRNARPRRHRPNR